MHFQIKFEETDIWYADMHLCEKRSGKDTCADPCCCRSRCQLQASFLGRDCVRSPWTYDGGFCGNVCWGSTKETADGMERVLYIVIVNKKRVTCHEG